MDYKPLTKDRAAEMRLTYHIKRGNNPEVEVTLEEYLEAANKDNKKWGLPEDNVPKMFVGGGMTGYVSGADEEKLV